MYIENEKYKRNFQPYGFHLGMLGQCFLASPTTSNKLMTLEKITILDRELAKLNIVPQETRYVANGSLNEKDYTILLALLVIRRAPDSGFIVSAFQCAAPSYRRWILLPKGLNIFHHCASTPRSHTHLQRLLPDTLLFCRGQRCVLLGA